MMRESRDDSQVVVTEKHCSMVQKRWLALALEGSSSA